MTVACDHLLGFTDGGYDESTRFYTCADYEKMNNWIPSLPDDQFAFCPRCGGDLEPIHAQVVFAIDAARQESNQRNGERETRRRREQYLEQQAILTLYSEGAISQSEAIDRLLKP